MQVNRFDKAKQYVAPRHNACVGYRLQGSDATKVDDFWVGMSHFLPGGGADRDASPFEKVYVVISGEITVETAGERVTLKALDSCVIGKNEERTLVNESHLPCSMLVVISTHKDAA
ncbi:MAG TPA: cupin domain-containing protein [Patescibacteria group bacterium]|nr:cupin domain-containing protein [Patescibacteria group bacterium]